MKIFFTRNQWVDDYLREAIPLNRGLRTFDDVLDDAELAANRQKLRWLPVTWRDPADEALEDVHQRFNAQVDAILNPKPLPGIDEMLQARSRKLIPLVDLAAEPQQYQFPQLSLQAIEGEGFVRRHDGVWVSVKSVREPRNEYAANAALGGNHAG